MNLYAAWECFQVCPMFVSDCYDAKVFEGRDSVKGNRQGSLSRGIKQLFETRLEFQKVQQPVEKRFRQDRKSVV